MSVMEEIVGFAKVFITAGEGDQGEGDKEEGIKGEGIRGMGKEGPR